MHIRQATIFGFGKWTEETVDFSDEAFICLYGENESGKSTIQQFILFILFGFSPKKRDYFRPKKSGKMGGRLTVNDPEIGEFVIERIAEVRNGAAVCYTSDGKTYNEAWLKQQLNGMTQATYQAIFSFSAVDLLDIREMKEDDLGEVLLGIGLTGSRNIHAIEKKLDTKVGELFKPFGKKPEINSHLTALDDLSASLRQYQQTEGTYKDKKTASLNLTDDINNLRATLKQEKDELFRIEKKQQALPIINTYHHEQQQFAAYPELLTFPENGIERLEQVNSQLLPLKSELAVLENNMTTYAAKQDAIRNERYEPHIYEQAKAIIGQKQDYLDKENDLERLRASIEKLSYQINSELGQLNIGISRDDLAAINLPFHIENDWNQLKSDLDQLALSQEQLQEEYREMTAKWDYLTRQQSKLEAALLDDSHENTLKEKVNHYYQHKHLKQDDSEQKTAWQDVKNRKEKHAGWILTGSLAGTVLSFIMAFIQNASVLFGLAVLIGVAGFGQWVAAKRSFREFEQMFQTEKAATDHVSEKEKMACEQQLAANDKKKRDLSTVIEQLRSVDMEQLKWEEKQRGIQAREDRLNSQLANHREHYPFLKQVTIAYWPSFFHTLKHVINLERDKDEKEEEASKLLEDTDNFSSWVETFFRKMNWQTFGRSMENNFQSITQLLDDCRNGAAMIDQYETWYADTADEYRQMKQKMAVYEYERDNLLTIAATETEDDFLKKGKQAEDKQKHAEKLAELRDQLAQILTDENNRYLMSDDELIDENQLSAAREQVLERIGQLEETIEQKRQQLADYNADLAMMESSETHSETRHRFTIEQAYLRELAEEWAVYKAAKELLEETKRNYRHKYLSDVIDRTTRYFHTLTGSTYKAIYPPEGDSPFRVEAEDGLRYNVDELSQGTVDQLYVALRLGISDVMSEHHRLPFIIDDAFVHFDTIRTKRIMILLSQVSENQQVILFTCKSDVMEAASNVNHILENQGIVKP